MTFLSLFCNVINIHLYHYLINILGEQIRPHFANLYSWEHTQNEITTMLSKSSCFLKPESILGMTCMEFQVTILQTEDSPHLFLAEGPLQQKWNKESVFSVICSAYESNLFVTNTVLAYKITYTKISMCKETWLILKQLASFTDVDILWTQTIVSI